MNKVGRGTVMSIAWGIKKESGKRWDVCMAKAWQVERLINALNNGVVKFAYEDKNGDLIKTTGILIEPDIPVLLVKDGRVCRFKHLDLTGGGYNSFRIDKLITIF